MNNLYTPIYHQNPRKDKLGRNTVEYLHYYSGFASILKPYREMTIHEKITIRASVCGIYHPCIVIEEKIRVNKGLEPLTVMEIVAKTKCNINSQTIMMQYADNQYNTTVMLPDIDSKDFLEQFHPNYFGSNTIAYLNDLECYLSGELPLVELKIKQPRTALMCPTAIEKEFVLVTQQAQIEALSNFHLLVCDNKMTFKVVSQPEQID